MENKKINENEQVLTENNTEENEETILSFYDAMREIISHEDLTTQTDINDAFDALLLNSFDEFKDINLYTEFPKIKKPTKIQAKDAIERITYISRLQKKNIQILSSMWYKLMFAKKEVLDTEILQKCLDESTGLLNVSILQRGQVHSTYNNRSYTRNPLFVTTIQFKLPPLDEQFEKGTIDSFHSFQLIKKLMRSNEFTTVESLAEIADKFNNFSIHEYYLPDGLSKESLDNALLLFRYDHDYRRHRNKILPPMYSDVYSEEVNEPHYHFNSSFGSLYGLSDKPKKNNVGAGYAISVTELINYLRKLRDAKPTDFISNNDYGMPFLHYKKSKSSTNTLNINDLIEQLDRLDFNNYYAKTDKAFLIACKIFDKINNSMGVLVSTDDKVSVEDHEPAFSK